MYGLDGTLKKDHTSTNMFGIPEPIVSHAVLWWTPAALLSRVPLSSTRRKQPTLGFPPSPLFSLPCIGYRLNLESNFNYRHYRHATISWKCQVGLKWLLCWAALVNHNENVFFRRFIVRCACICIWPLWSNAYACVNNKFRVNMAVLWFTLSTTWSLLDLLGGMGEKAHCASARP